MAEFCLDCWNKINGTNDTESKYVVSDKPEFCEECWEMKKVVICQKHKMDARNRMYIFLMWIEGVFINLKYFFRKLKFTRKK